MLTIYVPAKDGDLRPKRVKRVELRMKRLNWETAELPAPVLIMEDDSEIGRGDGVLYYEGRFIGVAGGIHYEQGALGVVDLVKRLLRDL